MGYLKLKNSIKLKIPVVEAKIKVHSEDSKNFNKYSQYILKLLYEKKSVEYISQITKFKKEQIENEIIFLIKYGLVNNNELDSYSLSEIGERIVTQIDEIDSFNSKNIKVLIDKYTGAVIKYSDDLVKVDGGIYKIVKDTYRNLNPVNSKRFFEENYNYYFTKSNLEELDIELYLGSEYWIEIEFDKLCELIDVDSVNGIVRNGQVEFIQEGDSEKLLIQDEEDGIKSLVIKGTVYKFKLIIRDESLNKYRNYIDKIRDLNELDETLVTANAKAIMNRFYLEENLNKELRSIFFDSISGIFTSKDIVFENTTRGNNCKISPIVKFDSLGTEQMRGIMKICFPNISEAMDINFDLRYELESEIDVFRKIPTSLIY